MKQRDNKKPELRRDTIKSHLIQEHRHDPYKSRGKLTEPTVCPQCSAAFVKGRWQWVDETPLDAKEVVCPACHRINDNYPAGELTLRGTFLGSHADEIIGLARNTEDAEKRLHAMQRIMAITRTGDDIVITTTDIHLPRRIGHAIEHAYKGQLETHYDEAGYFIHMSWRRDD